MRSDINKLNINVVCFIKWTSFNYKTNLCRLAMGITTDPIGPPFNGLLACLNSDK